MIHILNRREVFLTNDLAALDKAKEILRANHIEYRTGVNSGTALRNSRYRGDPFINAEAMNQYRLFVNKKDYERAVHFLPQTRI